MIVSEPNMTMTSGFFSWIISHDRMDLPGAAARGAAAQRELAAARAMRRQGAPVGETGFNFSYPLALW